MPNKKKVLPIAVIIVVIAVVCVGTVVLAFGTAEGGSSTTYTVYAIGGYSDNYALVLSPSVLEDVETISCWLNPVSQKGLIYGAEEIKTFIRDHGILKDQIRIVMVHDWLSSFVWEANANEKNMDSAAYAETMKENIRKELGF